MQFQVDDATLDWTWPSDHFDFIHARYLFGAVRDWDALFAQAHRCCKPGGWVQSCEADVAFFSDDGTTDDEPALRTWEQLYADGGAAMGSTFYLMREERQERAFERAGFEDITVVNYKVSSLAPIPCSQGPVNNGNSSPSEDGPRTPSSPRSATSSG